MKDAFENKIREKLEQAELESFDPMAWEKMKTKLDATGDDDKTGAFWWWWIPVLVLLLAGSIFIWPGGILLNKRSSAPVVSQHSSSAQSPSTTISSRKNDPSPKAKRSQQADSITTDKHDAIAAITPGKGTASDKTLPSGIVKATKQQAAVNNIPQVSAGVVASSHLPAAADEHKATAAAGHHPASTLPVQGVSVPVIAQKDKISSAANAAGEWDALHTIFSLLPRDPKITTALSLQRPMLPVKEVSSQNAAASSKPRKEQIRGFGVGLSLGADYNSAPSLKYGKIKPNFGVSVNYYINDRWSVSTGLLYSKKTYGATPSDYKLLKKLPPPSSPYYVVKKIDADCIVLDIPINVNYTFASKNRHSWAATAGLSSYFMIKENYCYIYAWATPKEIELNNKNQHYLSILNLGVTYQYSLGKHTTLGLQPYAKIPLRPIGFGEINLFSAGASIQLNLHGRR